jgi:exodeoxyribonuclease-3
MGRPYTNGTTHIMAKKTYRILSWNVNGLRAVLKKGFLTWFKKDSADILCLQEIKAMASQLAPDVLHYPGYDVQINSAERPGYSGVATFSKEKPRSVKTGFGVPRFDLEGRILQTDYPEFTLFNIYFPNGKGSPERLKYKMDFYEEALKRFMKLRRQGVKLVICGDVNTAHKEIDLARPRENSKISGFLPIERAWMDKWVSKSFVDSFRVFNLEPNHYTWWDVISGARARNVGWRIDYFFISGDLLPNLDEAFILPEVQGSDHCPVGITLKFS